MQIRAQCGSSWGRLLELSGIFIFGSKGSSGGSGARPDTAWEGPGVLLCLRALLCSLPGVSALIALSASPEAAHCQEKGEGAAATA